MPNSTLEFFEDLTETGCTCPPEDASFPNGIKEFYRVVKHNPATTECFFSYKKKNPDKVYSDECEARAISLSDSIEGLKNSYFRTPAGKKKIQLIGLIKLMPEDGMIKQTYGEGHYSFWRSLLFEPSIITVQRIKI